MTASHLPVKLQADAEDDGGQHHDGCELHGLSSSSETRS
jgi:hypothetical protein